MRSISRGELSGKGKDFIVLPSSLFRCLIWGGVHIDGCRWNDRQKGPEKEVGTLGIEVHRQWSVELCSRDAEGYNGNRDGRAGNLGSWMRDGAEGWKAGAVGSEDNVVGRVQRDLATTIRNSVVGLGRVDSEHVGGHLGREIVDHDGKFLRESRGCWKGSWLDASKDLVHSEEKLEGVEG